MIAVQMNENTHTHTHKNTATANTSIIIIGAVLSGTKFPYKYYIMGQPHNAVSSILLFKKYTAQDHLIKWK